MPFDGRGAVEVMEKVLRDPTPHIRQIDPDLPPALDELLAWAMEKDPELRPRSAGDFARMLEYVGEHPDDVRAVRRERRRRRRLPATTVMVYVIVFLVFACFCAWFLLRA